MSTSKCGLKYRVADGEILGAYHVAAAEDLDVQAKFPEEAMLPVPPDHPAMQSQRGWRVQAGDLQFTPVVEPEPRPTFEEFTMAWMDLLVAEVNRVRSLDQQPVNPDLLLINAMDLARRRRSK